MLLGRLSLCYGVGVGVSPGSDELGVGVILIVVLGVGDGGIESRMAISNIAHRYLSRSLTKKMGRNTSQSRSKRRDVIYAQ